MVQSLSWEANWFAASQEIPRISRTRRFITVLTSVRHLSLSWATPIQFIYPHPTSWRSILLLSTHLRLGLPSGLLPSGFPTKSLYTPLSSPIRATCSAHLILLDFITRTIYTCFIQGESLARGPKLFSIKNYVIVIMTWKFIYTYRERCKTGPAHNRCWNWSPFTSKHT